MGFGGPLLVHYLIPIVVCQFDHFLLATALHNCYWDAWCIELTFLVLGWGPRHRKGPVFEASSELRGGDETILFNFLVEERYTVDRVTSEFSLFMLVKIYIVPLNLLHALFALWLLILVKKIFLLGPRRHLL